MSRTTGERIWTVQALAQHWGVSARTVRREIAAGHLEHLRLGPGGRTIRITDSARRLYEAERRA